MQACTPQQVSAQIGQAAIVLANLRHTYGELRDRLTGMASFFSRLFGGGGSDEAEASPAKRGDPVTYVVPTENQGKKGGLSKTARKDYGENPLVIRVDKISGEFLADIVLRPDQEKILRDAQVGDLLAQGRVFIIKAASVDMTGS